MSVYKDENSGTWFCVFRYRDFTGKSVQKKKRGFRTKREAKDYENECQRKMDGQSGMTFRSLTELYLEDCKLRRKPNSYACHRKQIERSVLPYFADTPAKDITVVMVRKWQNETLLPRFKASTIRTYNRHLASIMYFGMRCYGLKENPVALAGAIRIPDREKDVQTVRFWTREQFERFLSSIKNPAQHLAYNMLFWTGMRNGELLGLRICDIDIGQRKIRIEQNKVGIPGEGRWILQTPKTRHSRRVIGITKALADELQNYLGRLHEPDPDDLLFHWSPTSLCALFHKQMRKMGFQPVIRLHDLRHSHASMLINMGISPKAIADRLGHANESMVIRIYGHLYPERRDEIVEKLDRLE